MYIYILHQKRAESNHTRYPSSSDVNHCTRCFLLGLDLETQTHERGRGVECMPCRGADACCVPSNGGQLPASSRPGGYNYKNRPDDFKTLVLFSVEQTRPALVFFFRWRPALVCLSLLCSFWSYLWAFPGLLRAHLEQRWWKEKLYGLTSTKKKAVWAGPNCLKKIPLKNCLKKMSWTK